ncbi:SDR family NAD(P)-dependent oxidoreductase [Streptomyces sp. SCSIO 30461]|uniref:SDR family NAD(P)-dependent oxidoreductase n=1 Tax=Streptomyces sp. SCSIO 30461 TaxID=3118085 RepID=UPI0030CD9699
MPDTAPGVSPNPTRHGAGRPVALITGASSGIGEATAELLGAEDRWLLLLNGRDEARLAGVAQRTGGTALPADLSDSSGHEQLVREALECAGRVDALVAGAGIGWAGPLVDMPADAVDRLLTVNLAAVVHLVRLLLPHMLDRDSGRIVLVGSMAGAVGVANEAVYSATKGALQSFADSLRYELAGTRIKVGLVSPGAVDTPFFAHRGAPYHRERPRPVSAERVARAVRRSLVRGRDDLFVPGWLGLPARLHGVAPGVFRSLAKRVG